MREININGVSYREINESVDQYTDEELDDIFDKVSRLKKSYVAYRDMRKVKFTVEFEFNETGAPRGDDYVLEIRVHDSEGGNYIGGMSSNDPYELQDIAQKIAKKVGPKNQIFKLAYEYGIRID